MSNPMNCESAIARELLISMSLSEGRSEALTRHASLSIAVIAILWGLDLLTANIASVDLDLRSTGALIASLFVIAGVFGHQYRIQIFENTIPSEKMLTVFLRQHNRFVMFAQGCVGLFACILTALTLHLFSTGESTFACTEIIVIATTTAIFGSRCPVYLRKADDYLRRKRKRYGH